MVASVGPFVDAAEANADAVGIQPGVYGMRLQMSGQAALDLLLDPAARLLSRVTLPEGLTVERTLARLAEATGKPIEEFQAAARTPLPSGCPPTPTARSRASSSRPRTTSSPTPHRRTSSARWSPGVQVLDELQIPVERRLERRHQGQPGAGRGGLGRGHGQGRPGAGEPARRRDGAAAGHDGELRQRQGRDHHHAAGPANPSPYNTYVHAGLPPGAISNPGEDALRAVLAPTPGDWRFFVVVDPDTGETRFAVTGEEHQQNVLLFQQWLRDHPDG